MKKSIVFVLLLCLTLTVFAEEKGHRLLVNGRTWNYMLFYYTGEEPDTVYHSITIEGPVEFDGKQCYKFANKPLEEVTNFFYEEGSKIYFYGIDYESDEITDKYVWKEIFNFDLKPGEKDVRSIDTIHVNGEYYRRLIFYHDVWIEGIGSRQSGVLYSWGEVPGTFLGSKVVSVYDGKKCIFTADDFNAPAYNTAQNIGHVFLKEGKTWNYELSYQYMDNQGQFHSEAMDYNEWICGDTVIAGQTYFKMCHSTLPKIAMNTAAYWREEDGRVYIYHKETEMEELLYDFNLKYGDEISLCGYNGLKVTTASSATVRGTERRVIALNMGFGQLPPWVEGVGNPGLLVEPLGHQLSDGLTVQMLSCYEGDECIFSSEDFNALTYNTVQEKGDANGDGTTNAADIVEVVNEIMGSLSNMNNKNAADVNGDGTVNAADIVAIVNIIMDN